MPESIIERIGKIPLRFTIKAFSRPSLSKSVLKYFDRIRDTFKKHKPPIYIGEHLGSGGFSDVFTAISRYDDETDFAIKILRNDLLTIQKDPQIDIREEEMRVKETKRRFTTESYVQWDLCQNLSENISGSVVKVFDFGEFDSKNNFRFILLERMGSTLRHFLNDKKIRSETLDVLKYKTNLMLSIAEIIANVHLEGIFHRDIKPENILFPRSYIFPTFQDNDLWQKDKTKRIQIKLADFGTVRWVKTYSSRYDGIIIGSQLYMSPEQIYDPDNLDQRTDIYSFGVVCYELLFGCHPKIINKDTTNILLKLAEEKPIQKTPPKGFDELYEIIIKCLQPLPKRYQSMESVVFDLRKFYEKI
jgi:serine/threonine protein kinase